MLSHHHLPRSAESDALLRSCIDSVHHLLLVLTRTPESLSILLTSMHLLLRYLLHPHPLVSQFFTGLWRILHAGHECNFEQWSTRIIVELLLTDDEQRAHEWYCNDAQAKLIDLLAQLTPEMTHDNQVRLHAQRLGGACELLRQR
jgi:hypothetical protein